MASPFSQHNPALQVAWDSTSLGWFKTCPRLYYYRMILQYETAGTAVPLVFGQAYHAALETYDLEKTKGYDHETALLAAVQEALLFTVEYGYKLHCSECDLWYEEGNDTCTQCGQELEYAQTYYLWEGDSQRNRETLLRSVVWYLDEFQNDPAETVQLDNGEPAVELGFRFEIDHQFSTGEHAMLCGHIDRLVEFNGQRWVMDRKTTKSTLYQQFFDKFTPDNQMSLYSFAGAVVLDAPLKGVIIDGAQVAVNFSEFHRGFALRSQRQIDEWRADLDFWLTQAEAAAQSGHWPMNDESCDKYGGCPFQSICSKDETVREIFLQDGNFRHFEWNPISED